MVYVLLVGLLTVFLVAFSYRVDKGKRDQGIMVNSILLLFTYTLCNFLSLVMVNYFSNYTITYILAQMSEILENLFILNFCVNIMVFPALKKHKLLVLVEVLIAASLAFSVFHSSMNVNFSPEIALVLYTRYLTTFFTDYRWKHIWEILYHYVLPGITALYIIVRPDNTRTRLARERLVVNLLALAVIAVSYSTFTYASKVVPLFYSLKSYGYFLALMLAFWATKIYVLFDTKSFIARGLQIFWLYVLPACYLSAVTVFALQYREEYPWLVVAFLVVALTLIFIRPHSLPKIFSRRNLSFTIGYEKELEQKLASLDYNLALENFGNQVDTILSEEIKSTGINILINDGNSYSSVYSSFPSIKNMPLEYPAFGVMIGVGRQVAMKNQLETHHALAGARAGLSELFEKSGAQVCILLAEGYRVFGLVLLGEKRLGNDYTSYDYNVFTKLYPYFFMVGYYMNSVANEGVIGTINREIRMSDQIIHSIQENMDFIRNPKVDVGYLMSPARNIGGEFIDFIRLTDTRHIMVLGAMSGRGITASMSMVIMKSILRSFLAEIHDFKELVQRINHFIRFNLPRGTYFAGVFALLDLGDNTMYYINCGVPTLMLYTQSYNNVIEIQGDGRVLGFVPDIAPYLKVKKIKLNPGDLVFACTEGMIESQSLRGEAFGKARIQRSIMDNLSYSSNKIILFTCENLKEFTSKEQEADITCLVMKVFADKEGANGTA